MEGGQMKHKSVVILLSILLICTPKAKAEQRIIEEQKQINVNMYQTSKYNSGVKLKILIQI
jgi:hypothetical protein